MTTVEVEVPPEPEPVTPEPVEVEVEPVIVNTPAPAAPAVSDGYIEEHGRTHDSLNERLSEVEAKLAFHDDMHNYHETAFSGVHSRIDGLETKLSEQPITTEPIEEILTEPIIEEPTIIPPDIPTTEVTSESKHWLRKLGF